MWEQAIEKKSGFAAQLNDEASANTFTDQTLCESTSQVTVLGDLYLSDTSSQLQLNAATETLTQRCCICL